MGGYGSGRYGSRAVIESQFRIKLRDLTGKTGKVQWFDDNGDLMASAGYFLTPEAATLIYRAEGKPYRPMVRLSRIPCRYGGSRTYFHCPRCYERVETIVLFGAGSLGCRHCLRLRYISQGLSLGDRWQRRADILYAKAGNESDDGQTIHKHKWMR